MHVKRELLATDWQSRLTDSVRHPHDLQLSAAAGRQMARTAEGCRLESLQQKLANTRWRAAAWMAVFFLQRESLGATRD